MDKKVFLQSLERLLRSLRKEERKKFTTYYSEIIEDYIEEGCTEEEAVKRVGDPGRIAQEILSDGDMAEQKPVSSRMKGISVILLILGFPLWGAMVLAAFCVLLSAALLVLSAYLLIWCIPVLAGVISVSSLIVSMVSMGGGIFLAFQNLSLGVMQMGTGILLGGIFILTGIGAWESGKIFVKISVRFSRWLAGLVKRKAGVKV